MLVNRCSQEVTTPTYASDKIYGPRKSQAIPAHHPIFWSTGNSSNTFPGKSKCTTVSRTSSKVCQRTTATAGPTTQVTTLMKWSRPKTSRDSLTNSMILKKARTKAIRGNLLVRACLVITSGLRLLIAAQWHLVCLQRTASRPKILFTRWAEVKKRSQSLPQCMSRRMVTSLQVNKDPVIMTGTSPPYKITLTLMPLALVSKECTTELPRLSMLRDLRRLSLKQWS